MRSRLKVSSTTTENSISRSLTGVQDLSEGVTDRKATVGELIARKLIELAKAGERDSESLKELTIEAVRCGEK